MIVRKVATKKGAPARSRARHVRDLCDYIAGPEAGDRGEKVEHRGALNLLTLDHDVQVQEMSDLAGLARSDAQPIQHWILSWRQGEQPTTAQVDEAVGVFVAELGLGEHQAMYALHRDTDNWHAHLAINRVHPESERLVTVNGGFDLEVAHRAIARIEHHQGWESEPRGRYRVGGLGQVERRDDEPAPEREPGARARDFENRTGEKSTQRTVIEEAASLMRQARTWTELHMLLSEQNLRFERKGSGAVLWVGDKAVKASVVGRDCSMSALEKRLGDYSPPPETSVLKPRTPQPVSHDPGPWPRYAAERRAHQQARQRDRRVLADRTRSEWSTMIERHRDERQRALVGNWRGKGAALNAMRSLLAARQAQEKAALRERHQGERQRLSRGDRRWPSFEDWLRSRDSDLADRWRFREREPAAITGEAAGPPRPRDIRDFQAEIGAWGILYRRLGQPSAAPAFTDRGKRIVIHSIDRESVLAALQLASQKWMAPRVSGPDAYRKLCVELAAEHGFKLSNPDLQQQVVAARSRRTGQQPSQQLDPRHLTAVEVSYTHDRTSSEGPIRGPLPARDVMDAYRRHFDDLSQEGRPLRDVSRIDELVSLRLRLTGHSQVEVERAIRKMAAQRDPAEKRDWNEYARRAARHAFGVSGDRMLGSIVERRTFLLRLEGKHLATGPDKEPKQTP
jgi:hypothetical protein